MVIKIGAGKTGAQNVRLGDASRTARYAAEAKAAADRAEESAGHAQAAAAVSVHPPVPGENGRWLVWDRETGGYTDSGESCRGEKGDKGDPGEVTEARLAAALAPYRTAAAQDAIDAAQDARINVLRPAASAEDVGKALIVKTVADGKATAYEFGEAGGGTGEVTTEQWLYSFPTGQASGAPASFDDGGDDLPIRALTVDIAFNQSGSGDPAPDNVRPITGWTGLTLSRSGEDTSAPDTYAVTFTDPATGDPLTVYGGKLMIHEDGSGELVSSYRAVMLDSLNYNDGLASSGVFRATLSGLEVIAAGKPSLLFCTKYKTVAAAAASVASARADYSVFQRSGYNQIYVKDTNCINYTAAQFKEYVSGVLLYYQLAEDAVYPLSAGQVDALRVNTLRGTNNIWADTGNVSVEYRADPGLFAAQSGGAVQSVNGKTGAVTLDAGDVGALPDGALAPYRTAAAQDVIDSGKLDAPSAAGTSGQLLGLDGQGKPVWENRDKSVTVPGTAPTITAASNTRYVCGEVTTLSLTPPASGVCDVIFTSGTTATVLTVPSTVKWANGFDPQSLDANTTYELNICDGLGVAAAWT